MQCKGKRTSKVCTLELAVGAALVVSVLVLVVVIVDAWHDDCEHAGHFCSVLGAYVGQVADADAVVVRHAVVVRQSVSVLVLVRHSVQVVVTVLSRSGAATAAAGRSWPSSARTERMPAEESMSVCPAGGDVCFVLESLG